MFDFFKVQKVTKVSKKFESANDFENIPSIMSYFKEETGIDFDEQVTIFKSKLTSFCRIYKISSFEKCLKNIKTDVELRQELINYLTTNESFFYREYHQIESLVNTVKDSHKHVEVLCVPCANGEEPYSIAIALMEAGVSKSMFHITGIDISSAAVLRSEEAIYNEKGVRNLSAELRIKYFRQEDEQFHLNEEVKEQVRFKCMNIFDEGFKQLGLFDYIFSRNMLIYFDSHTRLKAQRLFKEHLKDSSQSIYLAMQT